MARTSRTEEQRNVPRARGAANPSGSTDPSGSSASYCVTLKYSRPLVRACIETDVEPDFVPFEGGSLVAFVLSANLHRQHMTPGQQAAIVASAQDWAKAQTYGGARRGDQAAILPLETVRQRAAESGASDRTQRMADKVMKADPEQAVRPATDRAGASRTALRLPLGLFTALTRLIRYAVTATSGRPENAGVCAGRMLTKANLRRAHPCARGRRLPYPFLPRLAERRVRARKGGTTLNRNDDHRCRPKRCTVFGKSAYTSAYMARRCWRTGRQSCAETEKVSPALTITCRFGSVSTPSQPPLRIVVNDKLSCHAVE